MDKRNIAPEKLAFGAILPHTRLFGGVRRFFELGEILHRKGHAFTIFTPDGIAPDWLGYSIKTEKLSNLPDFTLDALFLTELEFSNALVQAKSKLKIFYHVGPRAKLHQLLKHKEITIFANSTNMYKLDRLKYGIKAVKAFGGVHVPVKSKEDFSGEPFKVMAFGRLGRRVKGTSLVVKACEKLYSQGYNIKLLLFDTPIDEASREKIKSFQCKVPFEFILNHPVEKNSELFQRADVFVAAERKAGWSNTSAEAMASGVPLIATKSGTQDFLINNETGLKVWRHPFFIRRAIKKLYQDREYARTLGNNGRKKIGEYSWENLARFIEDYVQSKVIKSE